jgi:hypothetical protein
MYDRFSLNVVHTIKLLLKPQLLDCMEYYLTMVSHTIVAVLNFVLTKEKKKFLLVFSRQMVWKINFQQALIFFYSYIISKILASLTNSSIGVPLYIAPKTFVPLRVAPKKITSVRSTPFRFVPVRFASLSEEFFSFAD